MYSGREVGETIEDGMNREEQRGSVMRTGSRENQRENRGRSRRAEEKQKQKQQMEAEAPSR